MKRVASACPLDCPDTCSLTVEVDESAGHQRIARVNGSELNPLTAGFICDKVRKIADHMYGPHRLRHPLIRDGAKGSGRFRRISWDEALDLLAERMRAVVAEHGGEAILPYNYGGSNGFLTQLGIDERLFRRLGASRLQRTLCAAPTGAAQNALYGPMPGVALEDYVHARLIVLWGVNPSASSIHLVPMIKEARKRGAALVVVDPRRTPLARQADLHIPLRPGTDLPVALGLIHWLFEHDRADRAFLDAHTTGADALRQRAAAWPLARVAEVSGVPADTLERFATMYADASPAVIRCGWGQERNRNGGSATAAILALPAVAGKFGVRGGGFTQSNGAAWGLRRDMAVAEPEPDTRTINMVHLGRVLGPDFAPPIKLLFVYNCNPVATAPDQQRVIGGLMREDLFTVVFDQVHTDTAALADLVLPATTFLEHRELRRGYGALSMFDSQPAVPPMDEARPNYEVFAALCRRLDLLRPDDPVTPDELVAAVLAMHPAQGALTEAMARDGMARLPPGATPILFADTFPGTASGRIRLLPEELDAEAPLGLYGYAPDPGTSAYPLALISPATNRTISSTFAQLIPGQVPVDMHPDDAAARGIADGDAVTMFNDLGTVQCTARLSRDVRRGVVVLPKGLWRQHTANGATSNSLVPDTLSDIGGGACYNDARVQIERAPGS